MSVVTCPRTSLPRDLDVSVSISRPLTEIATDMSLVCFASPNLNFPADNRRVRYYSSMQALTADVGANTPAYYAGAAFFARDQRPTTLAVGRIFETGTPAVLEGGVISSASISAFTAISDGSFDFTVDGTDYTVDNLDFTAITNLDDIITVIDTALTADSIGVQIGENAGGIGMSTITTGDGAEISYLTASASGTDISGLLMLTQDTAVALTQGYTPGDIASELSLISKASKCNGRGVFGWVLDAQYRDTADQKTASDWAEAQTPAYISQCTNSALAYNTADDTNIAYYAMNQGYKNTSVIYHHNPGEYPEMSYIALALSVNYAMQDSTLTMKFKQLDGCSPSPLSETQVAALDSRNCNCYVLMGNTTTIVREGKQSADTWFTDSLVNLENYREELQVEVYNVFLRNPKVPYTSAGQNKLISAAAKINRRYEYNGTFAAREVEANTETGYTVVPATTINPTPVYMATASERAARIAPPIAITAYEAGAFHKVSLLVSVYN